MSGIAMWIFYLWSIWIAQSANAPKELCGQQKQKAAVVMLLAIARGACRIGSGIAMHRAGRLNCSGISTDKFWR